jgi:transcriptional regulator of acetoin/glycerol metabolism
MKTEGNLNFSYLENLEQDFLDKEVRAGEIIRKAPEVPFFNYSRNKIALFDEEKFMMNVFWFFIKTFSMNKPITLKGFINRFERTVIFSVLSRVNGNQKKAAEILGVRYTTLNEKVKRHKIRFHKHPV